LKKEKEKNLYILDMSYCVVLHVTLTAQRHQVCCQTDDEIIPTLISIKT